MEFDYETMYKAWGYFRNGKKPTGAIDAFAYNLEANLQCLSQQIQGRTYRHGSYQRVIISEKKRRDLAVATVRDRVVHRLLYDYLVSVFDKSFDPDVWSCRKGKGLHKCLARTQKLLQKHRNSFIWRADITKFFDHVDQKKLLGILARKINCDSDAIWLCREVIASYTTNRTEQNRTEQNRTEQNRTEQNRTEQNRTEQAYPLAI